MEKREEKLRAKKGLWKPEEDLILKTYVETHGEGKWATVSARSGLKRGGKSCRLRWKNYLRPDIKRGGMSQEEEDLIIRMHKLLGNRWSLIAGRLPGRTDNEVKNYWNTHLNKRHQSGKRKATDRSNYSDKQKGNSDKSEERRKRLRPPSNSQTSLGSESLENPTEEVDEEEKGEKEEAILAGDTSIWEPQSWNYYIGSPTAPAINETIALDDGPFIAYLESFVFFESLNQIDETSSNCIMQHSHMP